MIITADSVSKYQLRVKSPDVDINNINNYSGIISQMKDELDRQNALGLAAIQMGYQCRIIIVRDHNNKPIVMINPTYTDASPKGESKILCKEGCLSFPNLFVSRPRLDKIWVNWTSENGRDVIGAQFEDIQAVCVQHEVDHLDGKLFFDGVSDFKIKRAIVAANKKGSNYSFNSLQL